MKWIYLLWSVVCLGALALFFAWISSRVTGKIDPTFAWGAIAWFAISVLSPIIILLRLFRIIQTSISFIYILIGTANFVIGILGLYVVIHGAATMMGNTIIVILLLNILIASFIYIDSFIATIPGFRKSEPLMEKK